MSPPTAPTASPGCAIPSSVRTARLVLQPAATPRPSRNPATHLPPTISSPSERDALLRDGRATGEVLAVSHPISVLAAAPVDGNGSLPWSGGADLRFAPVAGLAISAGFTGRWAGRCGSVQRRGPRWKGQDAQENKSQRGRRQPSAHSAHLSPPFFSTLETCFQPEKGARDLSCNGYAARIAALKIWN